MARPRTSPESRFWPKVKKTDTCWLWTAQISPTGYGRFNYSPGSGIKTAHRASWVIHNGPVPEGLWVLHKCDVRNCVNPAHLFLGTHLDNMRDMCAKGRKPWNNPQRGAQHFRAKLSEDEVRSIRRDIAGGTGIRALARHYAVDQKTIRNIRDRVSWTHI